MKKSKWFFLFLGLIISLGLIFGPVALAQDTATVAATVTAQNISVSVSDGVIAYGTIGTSSTKDTTTGGVDDSQTATNNGNITEDFNIKAVDSTSSGAGWTLGATVSSETYTMKFCTSDCDGTPTWSAVGINPSYQTLVSGVAASGTQDFDLQVGTPTTTTDYNEQSITVTIQAVAG